MSELDNFQVSQADLINTRNTKAEELRAVLQSIKKKHNELLEAQQQGSSQIDSLQSAYDTLLTQSQTLRSELNASEDAIITASVDFYDGENGAIEDVIGSLSSENPVLFFPVRLETKFRGENENKTLDIRIYPDDLMIQTHEHLITEMEFTSAKVYWNSVWIDGTNIPTEQQKLDAWDSLVKTYGKERSSWIRKQSTPTNIIDVETNNTTPSFPNITTNSDSWTEQPYTRILPDRFVIVAYPNDVNGVSLDPIIKVGNPIPEKVKIGVSPSFDDEGVYIDSNHQITSDSYTQWMIDFETDENYSAVAIGLGLKMPLMTNQAGMPEEYIEASEGFSKIIAWGIKTSIDDTKSKNLIEDLLDNHHYTQGFSLLKQGVSTKNDGNTKSGYSSYELDSDQSHKIECEDNLFTPVNDDKHKTDGQRLAEALGVSYEKLYHVENSDGLDIRNAVLMNNVMWAGGTGFYMSEMMHPLFSTSEVTDAREFYTDFISARGAIPSIRLGKQPYGILPISSNTDITWSDSDSKKPFYDKYKGFFNKIDNYWKANVSAPVSSENSSENSLDDILKTLGRNALTTERYIRSGAGPELVWNSLMLENRHSDAESWHSTLQSNAQTALSEMGFETNVIPKILLHSFSSTEAESDVGLAADNSYDNSLNNLGDSNENYIDWLLNSDLQSVIDEDFSSLGADTPPKSLMYKALRQSLLTEYWTFAADLLELTNDERRLTEFFNDGTIIEGGDAPDGGALTIGKEKTTYFAQEYSGTGEIISEIIDRGGYAEMDTGNNIVSVRSDLTLLSGLTSKELNLLFNEQLDINTHRLDAWMLGPVQQRLKYLRNTLPGTSYANRKTGTYIGSYGWLMNVAEQTPNTTQQTNKFMLAPSINQAITAALLRNGYDLSNNFISSELSAVNLTSERVREALFIIDGLIKGNSLGEILGYQFEKGLQNNYQLTAFIDDIRNQFPFTEITTKSNSDSLKSIRARGVVNGLKLIQQFQNNEPVLATNFEDVFGSTLNSNTDSQEKSDIIDSAKRICAIMDALGDLAVAEGVFQIVQGNYERAGALSNALASSNMPVIPEVMDIQRKGIGLTHKVSLNIEVKDIGELASVYSLPIEELTARQKIEPSIDFWIHSIIGSSTISNTKCEVKFIANGEQEKLIISLFDLGLTPVDTLYVLGAQELDAEMRERLVNYSRTKSTVAEISDINIDFKYKASGGFSYYEIQAFMKRLYKTITDAQPLKTADYSWKMSGLNNKYDLNELLNRTEFLLTDFTNRKQNLKSESTGDDFSSWVNALFEMSQFGITQTMTQAVNENLAVIDEEILYRDTQNVIEIAETRISTASEYLTQMRNSNNTDDMRVESAISVIKVLLGNGFVALPHYKLDAAAYSVKKSLESTVLLSDAHNSDNIMAMEEWLHDAGKVRERISKLETLGLMAESIGSSYNMDVEPIQIPYDALDNGDDNNRWMGLEVEKERMKDGKVCFAIKSYSNFLTDVTNNNYLCGFMIDDWTEIIPMENHSAALAINYNQPNAQAPQSLLLAVPSIQPDRGDTQTLNWIQSDIQNMLVKTLDSVVQRNADFDAIKATHLGKFLPLTVYPVTGNGSKSIAFNAIDFRKDNNS